MTASALKALLLPTRTPLPPALVTGLTEWLSVAMTTPPTPAGISLWRGLMSVDAQGKVASAYAVGWIELGWRRAGALSYWQQLDADASVLMPSVEFLAWQADLRRLAALPLYPVPRARWQPPDALRREARVLAYLRQHAPLSR